jgi:nicotinate-nucleotide pyrophosphorylase (carboxylating)
MNWLLVDDIIRAALIEDIGHGDITTALTPGRDTQAEGNFLIKQDGVLCGGPVAARCFEMVDNQVRAAFKPDGTALVAGDSGGTISGPGGSILTAERVALNFLQRLSGIATMARQLAELAHPAGIRIVETRKTTPGLRTLEKYAVRTGTGYNHRMDLDHAVMLKDNHFALAGMPPAELVKRVVATAPHTMRVVAEAGAPGMVAPLVEAGAHVVLLDNFSPDEIRAAVAEIDGRAVVEVSGGVNAANLREYLIPGVDVISIGALTHSYRALDISLNL